MTHRTHAVLCCLVAGALTSHAVAQRTWVVAQVMGPGVDYTDIPPAVAAAAPWDRIEVRGSTTFAPTYSSFVVDKPLDVEATQGASVFFFRVENLTAGQVARVAGLRCEPRATWTTQHEAVIVQNCQGKVLLAGLDVWNRSPDSPGFIVRDAVAVAIQDCVARGRSAGLNAGGAAIHIARSGVCVVRATLTGGRGGSSSSNAAGYNGGNGLDIDDASVFVADATITGGNAGYGFAFVGDGGDAVTIAATSNSIVTVSNCTLTRGTGTNNGNAVRGTARVTQDCVLTGPLVGGAVSVAAMTRLRADATVVLGGSIAVTVEGASGTGFLIAFDLGHGHQFLPGINEPLLLPTTLTVAQIGVLGASPFVWNFAVPNSPLLAQLDLFFQGAGFGSFAGVTLTALAATRMR